VLLNGAQTANIVWCCTGAVAVGAAGHLRGNVISIAAIGFGAGASLDGRALAFGSGASTLSATVVINKLYHSLKYYCPHARAPKIST
jgi:hypothetical protein